ncbi:hypothetical protein AB5N19_10502 [Seiridium cardinale]
MRTSTLAASAAAFAGLASATPSATIVIQASHGGAGSGLTNNTISVPVGPVYTNAQALSAVSTLYLTGASEIPVDSIICTPYAAANGTGSRGLPFTSSTPSYLSTNTVQVGSIVCLSNATAGSSSGGNGTATGGGNSTSTNATTTLRTTYSPTAAATGTSTPTSTPGTSGAMSAHVPYAMTALLLGAASFMFTL